MNAARAGSHGFDEPMNDRRHRRTAISIGGLIKRYTDGSVADQGIDLNVYEGEVLSVLGPNGAGKTTLTRFQTSRRATGSKPAVGSSRTRIGGSTR